MKNKRRSFLNILFPMSLIKKEHYKALYEEVDLIDLSGEEQVAAAYYIATGRDLLFDTIIASILGVVIMATIITIGITVINFLI